MPYIVRQFRCLITATPDTQQQREKHYESSLFDGERHARNL